ncbi:MAG: M1 family aminopeptidase [Polyangiales bacterium]
MRALAAALLLLGCTPRAAVPAPRAPEVTAAPETGEALPAEPAGPLPEGVTPLRYALSLEIVPSRDRFRGEVQITARLDRAVTGLWLHGRDLEVTSAEVSRVGVARAARWVPGERPGVASLRWEGPLGPGEVTLRLAYTAPFNRQLEGLYRVDSGGDAYAFTQFEALSARRALPCFDDPRFKTPFDLTLTVPRDQVAVTNTPELSSAPQGDSLRAVRFAPTEPLPTYLLAFAVGPLDVVEHEALAPNEIRTQPVPLRGVATRGRGALLARALDDAGPLVATFERYFARAYPYPKLDLIAVPDFAAGAMENAGAITFRDSLLLLRPDAPVTQVRRMDSVLAHELAHHWFGDLVTLRWWDDLWLNESFATWAAAWATDAVFPAHAQRLALLGGVHYAMGADALSTAVPVRRPIPREVDLRGGSSAIVYQKGASVLGMIERWMGHDAFRDGVRAYLRAHEHGSATAADLLSALRATAGERDLDAVAASFIDQPGVPVLATELVCAGGRARVRVSQRRFSLPAGSDTRPGAWTAPVCVRHLGAGDQPVETCAVVDAAHPDFALPGACPEWIMPNAEGVGYYRWSLTPAAFDALVTRGWPRLSERERLHVVTNAQAMFSAGVLTLPRLRPLLARAATDPGVEVAHAAFPLWNRILDEHLTPAQAAPMRREAARPYLPARRALGWSPRPGEPSDRSLRRRDLAAFLGLVARDPAVLAEGARRGAAHVAGTSPLPPEMVGPCVAMHLRGATEADVTRVIERALTSDDAVERDALLAALGEAPTPLLVSRVLPMCTDPRLRVNEVLTPLRAAMRRHESRADAFAWFTAHADEALGRLSEGARAGAPWLAAGFCDEADRARVESFFAPRAAAIAGSEGQLRGALEAIAVCAAEREAQRSTITR